MARDKVIRVRVSEEEEKRLGVIEKDLGQEGSSETIRALIHDKYQEIQNRKAEDEKE